MADEPIVEADGALGMNVVHIEDLRVARGLTRRPHSSCEHNSLIYDSNERRIWCRDCERDVDPFDAFTMLTNRALAHQEAIDRRWQQLREAESFQLRSRAAKVMDKAWRSRNRVPACPHCKRGIFPEDVVNGVASLGKKFAERLNEKEKQE